MKALLLLLAVICFSSLQCGCSKNELKVDDKAPEFELANQDGECVKLADFKGKKVALYFYPRDNTPGCKQEACSLRDGHDMLAEQGIIILGIGEGNNASKKKFITKQHLNFPLLVATQDIYKAYGVDHGILYFFFCTPKRWTFLIDENGIIVGIIKNVDTKNHAQQILNAFNEI